CEIINIINICIIHNASEYLLKQNIDTYTKHKEQIQKQELNKIIKKLQNKINNGDEKNFYETIRRLQINNNIQIQDNMGIVIHQDKDKAITIGKYFQQLFKHKYHMDIQWENEINTKTQEYINQTYISYDTILDEHFNEKEILDVYYTLDNNKSTFLDEISNELISLLIKNNPNQMTRLIN
ncbi:hypothetical protein RFI_35337, partial [Reticulomyxa filosa]